MIPHLIKSIWIIPFLIVNVCSAQVSHTTLKKELRQLDGSAYVLKAFEGAEELAKNEEYKSSLDLINKGIRKARSMGKNPSIVVKINKVELIIQYFPINDKWVSEVSKELEDITKQDPPIAVFSEVHEMAIQYSERLDAERKVKFNILLKKIEEAIIAKNDEFIDEEKKDKLKAFKKLRKEEAFYELEKLKVERQRLETLQTRLSKSVEKNEMLLSDRRNVIHRMSSEQAKKEAIIQLNQRLIDSLRFSSELDSINLISHERLINEQKSEIALQIAELDLKDAEIELKSSQQKLFIASAILGMVFLGFLSWVILLNRKNYRILKAKNEAIELEKERSEKLLLNILPKFIANELKESSVVKTRTINLCTVLFTDFVNFSSIAKILSPHDLIAALDECFRAFDRIVSKYNIEKIKTIGDAYMCAGGVPMENESHAIDAVDAASEMVQFLDSWNEERENRGLVRFDARIGIHSGPIISGVVGEKKFAYDIWGDTVNIASRLESQSKAQKINISSATYELVKEHFICSKRGTINAKNMADVEMYFVDCRI